MGPYRSKRSSRLPYLSDRRSSWVSRLTWSCRFKLSVFVAFSASSDVLSLSWRSPSFANSCSLTRRISAPFRWQSSILSRRSTIYFRSPLKASRYSWIGVHGMESKWVHDAMANHIPHSCASLVCWPKECHSSYFASLGEAGSIRENCALSFVASLG